MDAYGIALFCDDVREEAHGKISLMGLYGADLVISAPSLPVVLPKFFIVIQVRFPANNDVENIVANIYLPQDVDKPSIVQPLDWRAAALPDDHPLPFPDASPSLNFGANLAISPLIVSSEGFLRVRLFHREQVIKVGALQISFKKTT